ncbi:LysR family transcriptional regulator [Pseudomonas sp. LB3P14]
MPALSRADLADLNVFSVICRRRSFRFAAAELGVSTSALSHAMRNLENRLGVKLLNRTSRSVVPTAAGSALVEGLEQGFGQIEAAMGELERYRNAPMGRLRLNVPRDASRLLLGPIVTRFCQTYPDIKLEIIVDDNMVDIIKAGFDAGIRYGATVPQDLVAVPLTKPLKWVVVGSPLYLERHGRPEKPEDLLQHECIRIRIGDNSIYKWELGDGDDTCEIDVPGPVIVNETDIALDAAIDGLGLAYCLELRVAQQIADGRLEVVLPSWASTSEPMVMYYPSRRQVHPGLRQLIEVIRSAHL